MPIEWKHTSHEDERWYAIYVKSRTETKVQERLTTRAVEAYLPLRTQLRKWSDRKKWVTMPLFPGYLFVRISSRQFQTVLETTGVLTFVHFSGRITSVPDSQIESIKLLLLSDADFEVEPVTQVLERGEMVQVTSGILQGIRGEVIESRGKKKIAIIVDQLGTALTVEVPIAALQVLQPELTVSDI